MASENLRITGGSNDRFQTRYNQERPGHNQPTGTTKKTYFFAILAIVGFSGLIVGVVGLVQVLQSGALTNQAIIMMATGGGGGTLLLIIGIVGLVKNRQRASHQLENTDTNIPVQTNRVRQAAFIERTAVGSIRDMQRFGKVEWEHYFGVVPDEPSLPNNLDEILNALCPFSGDDRVKVKDTHMLVLIPATVAGEALNLNRLQELIQNPKENSSGHVTKYDHYDNDVRDAHGNTGPGRSYWVLMTRDVIPGSRKNVYSEQKKLVRQHEGVGYTLPKALEAAVCILVEHVVSGNKLFGENPLTLTRCSEVVLTVTPRSETIQDPDPVVFGAFGSKGPFISSDSLLDEDIGVAALRKF